MASCVILDATEDAASLRAKLDGADGDGMIIVAPRDVAALRSPLLLRVIERFALGYDAPLTLVVQDGDVAAAARERGIKTRGSLLRSGISRGEREAVAGILKRSKRPSRWLGSWFPLGKLVGAAAVLLLLAIPLAAAALVLPEATVIVPVASTPVGIDRTVQLSEMAGAQNDGTLLPARRLQVRYRVQVETAREGELPAGTGVGTVLIANRAAEAVRVPRGAELISMTNRRFTVRDEVMVPGNGVSTARVRAVETGPAGVAAVGTVTRFLDASLNTRLSPRNAEAFTATRTAEVGAVTLAELDRLRIQAQERAQQLALGELKREAGSSVLIEESIAGGLVGERFSAAAGEFTDTLKLEAEAVVAGWVYSAATLERFGLAALESRAVPLRQTGNTARTVVIETRTGVGGEQVTLVLRTTALVVPEVDVGRLEAALLGLPLEQAGELIGRQAPLRGSPTVRVEPNFFGRLPWFDWRITVRVDAG